MNMDVLAIAEDTRLCDLICSLLEARGHSVSARASGAEAAQVISSTPPDVVIAGDQLADMDAINWISSLRKTNKELKVVLVAKVWPEADLYRALTKDLKVSLIVQRPFKPALFGPQIESLFQEKSGDESEELSETRNALMLSFRKKFADSVPRRLAQISQTLESLNKQSGDQTGIGELRRLSHNLKGTSRSCGFDRLGDEAEIIESAMKTILESPEKSAEKLWAAANAALSRAHELAREMASEQTEAGKDQSAQELAVPNAARVRVLVVSGDEQAMPPTLDGCDFPVDVIRAAGREETLARASELVLDAVMIDYSEVACALAHDLRALNGCEDLPLAFICDGGIEVDRAASAHAGISTMLQKPVQPDKFAATVNSLIASREGGRPKILIVDDDDDFTALVSLALGKEGMLVRAVHDPAGTIAMLDQFIPDLLLLDVNMPGMSGFEVCKQLRALGRWQDLPILFLTAQTDLQSRLNAFDAGGDDYLPKPVATVELVTRVKVRLERARMLKERSDRDMLSGLLLRRAFSQQLSALLKSAQRHGFPVCVSLIDVDHFKKVNDVYGHLTGDAVLAYFGQLLRRSFRAEDLRGRWGGEEFILAFRDGGKQTMQMALGRVLDEVRSASFRGDNNQEFSVSFSAGISCYPEDGADLHDLLSRADQRLYAAKSKGRNQIAIE